MIHESGTLVASEIILSNVSQLFVFFTQAIYFQFATKPPDLNEFYGTSPKIYLFKAIGVK